MKVRPFRRRPLGRNQAVDLVFGGQPDLKVTLVPVPDIEQTADIRLNHRVHLGRPVTNIHGIFGHRVIRDPFGRDVVRSV